MLKLITHQVTPPGGYRDTDPDTKFTFVADNFDQLVEKERAHLKINKRPIPPDLYEQIENRLCHLMPPGTCVSTDGEIYRGGQSRYGYDHIINNSIGMRSGTNAIDALAEKRAAVCVACPHNVAKGGCGTCKGVHHAIRSMTNGASTALDHRLHVCDILGVFCKVLVRYNSPVVSRSHIERTPKECWVRNTNRKGGEHGGE